MKKFLFYFLIFIFLFTPAAFTQTQSQYDIEQTVNLVKQSRYDEALNLIYSLEIPSDKQEQVLYYLVKIKALQSTPYRANKLEESQTDPTKFTAKQKQEEIKKSYKELWNLHKILIDMPYEENKKYLGYSYFQIEPENLYDALVNAFIGNKVDTDTKIYEESYKLGGTNRDGIREYWHIKYILAEIAKKDNKTSFNKENLAELAQFFAAISGQENKYSGQFKKYFFEAKTLRGKYEAALQSANYYRQAEDYFNAHKLAEYCAPFEIKNNSCISLKKDLERPSAYITESVPQNYKPNTVLPIKFTANNLKQVTFNLYKLSLQEMQKGDYQNLAPYKTFPQQLIYEKPYTPKNFEFNLPALGRGFYALTLNYEGENYPSAYFINITDLALLATNYFNADNLQNLNYKDTNVHFYALSAKNGVPFAAEIKAQISAPVKADISYNVPDEIITKTIQTNKEGQANVKNNKSIRDIVAKYKNNYALINSIYPQNYNKPNPMRIYINTDRAIYKPGEEVQMVFNVFERKNNNFFAYSGKEKLQVAVKNASHKTVAENNLTVDTFGQAVYNFKIPQDTMLGTFQVSARFENGGTMANAFQVEEFKQPEFEITLQNPDKTYSFNEKVTINGKAAYYSGEALANAHVVFSITKQRFYPCCYRWDNFDFEDEEPVYFEMLTDKNGNFNLTFTPKAKKKEKVLPAHYLIKAEVTGTNGHTIIGETNLYVSNQKYFFSIEQNKNFFLTAGENSLTLKMQNAAGKAQKGKAVFELFEAKKKEKTEENNSASKDDFELSKEAIFKADINFDGEEILQKLPALKEGFYGAKLKIGKDESQVFFFPVFDGSKPNLDVDGNITLMENKKYSVGESAKILLGANNAKGIKFVEIYKNGFFVKRIKLPEQPLQILTLPILPDYQGGISLRWFGIYDYQVYGGTLNIEVPYLEKEVKIELNVPENLEPGKQTEINLTANIDGKPLQQARAMITVYDKALDYYVRHNFALPSPYTQEFGYNNIYSSLQGNHDIYYANMSARAFGMERSFLKSARAGSMMAMEESAAAPMLAKNAAVQDTYPVQNADINPIRIDFAPTAYFNPKANLQDGKTKFTFKMPDSLTAWTAAAVVFTKTLQTGKTEVNFTTRKDLTLRLETPKFIRQNDEINFVTLVKNNTQKTMQAEVSLILKVNNETSKNYETQQVKLKAGEEKSLTWFFKAPKELGEISLTAVARSGDFIDGETRTIPLLTIMQYLPNSKTVALKEGGNSFELQPIKEGEILDAAHLILDTSLLVPVLSAMPMLTEQAGTTLIGTVNRYLPLSIINQLYNTNANFRKAAKQIERNTKTEKWNKQTSEILLQDTELSPWYNLSQGGQSYGLINIFDSKIVAREQKRYQEELKKYQNSDGGFAWIKGGKSNLFITLQVIDKLAQASYFGVKPPMELTQKALKYLHNEYKKFDFKKGNYSFDTIYYAYVISAFDKTLLVQSTRQEVQAIADFVEKQDKNLSPLGKVYMAVIFSRLGNQQKAKKYINSLFETATENDITGTRFAMEERSWQWFDDGLTLHAEALRMLLEVAPNSAHIDGLIKWIIFDKKATMWGSATNAAKAVYALLEAIKTWNILDQNISYDITWNGQNYKLNVGALDKENKTVFSVYAPQANNNSLKANIVQNTTAAQGKKAAKSLISFATLSNLVISDLPQKESQKGVLNISKEFYLIEGNTVRPLKENETVKIGSKIQVRLTIKAEHNFDFVTVQDKKPAAFDTEKLLSGWVWDGLPRYEDLQLAQTNFFMDRVPVGTYELKYILRPTAEGVFNVGSSVMQSMFAPEISAHSGSFIIRVEN